MSEAEKLREIIAEIRTSIASREHQIAVLESVDFTQMTTDEIIARVSDPETRLGSIDIYMSEDDHQWSIADPAFGPTDGQFFATFREALIAYIAGEISTARDMLEDDRRELRALGVEA